MEYLSNFSFMVADKKLAKFSYLWTLKADKTSFYIYVSNPHFFDYKFSLHGPDPRPDKKPIFKFDRFSRDTHQPGTITDVDYDLPLELPGDEIFTNVFHVLRFRFGHELFRGTAASAPPPKSLKNGRLGGVVKPPPGHLRAVDVDIYLSRDGRPYWPSYKEAAKERAALGPMKNDSGEILTGQVFNHPIYKPEFEAPENLKHPYPRRTNSDHLRGIAISGDDRGVLWVAESLFDRNNMKRGIALRHDNAPGSP